MGLRPLTQAAATRLCNRGYVCPARARRMPGAPSIQMNVPAICHNALAPNITPSSSPGTLSTSTLYDCWHDCCHVFAQQMGRSHIITYGKQTGTVSSMSEENLHIMCNASNSEYSEVNHHMWQTDRHIICRQSHEGSRHPALLHAPQKLCHIHSARHIRTQSHGGLVLIICKASLVASITNGHHVCERAATMHTVKLEVVIQ